MPVTPFSMRLRTFCILGTALLATLGCGPLTNQSPKTTLAAEGGRPAVDSMVLSEDTVMVAPLTSWSAFERFEGRYAYDVHLINLEPLHARLQHLLGTRAETFTERYQVMPPIDVDNQVLFNEGCMPHNCLQDEAALAIDMRRDIVYVGIAENKQVSLYGENGDTVYPARLLAWKQKFVNR